MPPGLDAFLARLPSIDAAFQRRVEHTCATKEPGAALHGAAWGPMAAQWDKAVPLENPLAAVKGGERTR